MSHTWLGGWGRWTEAQAKEAAGEQGLVWVGVSMNMCLQADGFPALGSDQPWEGQWGPTGPWNVGTSE